MQEHGIGITHADITKIPMAFELLSGPDTDQDGLPDMFEDALILSKNRVDTDYDGYPDKDELINGYNAGGQGRQPIDLNFTNQHLGKIFIQTENNGEAWYINPSDSKRYFLGRPADAFAVMRELSLGINSHELAKIHKPELEESLDEYSSYEHLKITANGKEYSAELVRIDLKNPNLKIITDVAHPYPTEEKKSGKFGAKSLGRFVLDNEGFAGINGSFATGVAAEEPSSVASAISITSVFTSETAVLPASTAAP